MKRYTENTTRTAIIYSLAEQIWNTIPNKTTRKHPHVFLRHAFFVACRHKGLKTVHISSITGFDHSTTVYATKMHQVNMEVRDYKEAYRNYIERMTEVDELREVVLLKQELEITRRNMREIEAQLKEREEEALVLEKFGA